MAIRAVLFLTAYFTWVLAFRLAAVTLLTYVLVAGSQQRPRLEELSEMLTSSELFIAALGSLSFVVSARMLYPITSITWSQFFNPARFEKRFLPGFLRGSALSAGFVAAFILAGYYRYLGIYIQLDEATLSAFSILFRALSLVVMAYCEEFIFRQQLADYLRKVMPDAAAIALTTLAYCVTKSIQFDLGMTQLGTLVLLSVALGAKAIIDADFTRGAGYWAGILFVLQPLLSLPVLGTEFPGILLIKYQAENDTGEYSIGRFLTGGVGGPLSSFGIQLFLLVQGIQIIIKYRKIFLNLRPAPQ